MSDVLTSHDEQGLPDRRRRWPVAAAFAVLGLMLAVAAASHAEPGPALPDLGLVGHSLGGAVRLYTIAGVCQPGICSADPARYAPPSALMPDDYPVGYKGSDPFKV